MLAIGAKDRWGVPREDPHKEIGGYRPLRYGRPDTESLEPAEPSAVGDRKNESQPKSALPRRNPAITWRAQERKRGTTGPLRSSARKCQGCRKFDGPTASPIDSGSLVSDQAKGCQDRGDPVDPREKGWRLHVGGTANVDADVQWNVPAASKVHQRDKPPQPANPNVLLAK